MNKKKILHVDQNHPCLIEGLEALGFSNEIAYETPVSEILKKIHDYSGLIIRSRFTIDQQFIDTAEKLQFIGRVGAGLENIDVNYAASKNIQLIAAPEGNRNAVGEHTLGMLLGLTNKLHPGHQAIQKGQWLREEHRGWELEGKTIGIMGYGNMGNSFAKKLSGFDVEVLCYDIKDNVGNKNAKQVSLKTLQEQAQVISLHTPQTPLTQKMIDADFIAQMHHPFWLLNTARGSAVVTADLVSGLKSGKVLGAGLDVMEYESKSFTSIFSSETLPSPLQYLLQAENVLLSPHVGGWTLESHRKLADTIVKKIRKLSFN